MKCGCGHDTRVVDSRHSAGVVRRRRVCEHCGTRTTTWETTTPPPKPPKPPKPPVDEREREIKRQIRLARQAVLKRRRREAMTPEQRAEMLYREKLRRAGLKPTSQ